MDVDGWMGGPGWMGDWEWLHGWDENGWVASEWIGGLGVVEWTGGGMVTLGWMSILEVEGE